MERLKLRLAIVLMIFFVGCYAACERAPIVTKPVATPVPLTIGEYCIILSNVVGEICEARLEGVPFEQARDRFVDQVASRGSEMQGDIMEWTSKIYADKRWTRKDRDSQLHPPCIAEATVKRYCEEIEIRNLDR